MSILESFPFTKPAGSDANMFIQWKGTDVCLDFICECGFHGHIDDSFVYYVECSKCGNVYQMGTQVIAKKVTKEYYANSTTTMLGEPGVS